MRREGEHGLPREFVPFREVLPSLALEWAAAWSRRHPGQSLPGSLRSGARAAPGRAPTTGTAMRDVDPAEDADGRPPARVSTQSAAVIETETQLVSRRTWGRWHRGAPDGVCRGGGSDSAEEPHARCQGRRVGTFPIRRRVACQERAGPLIQISQGAGGEGRSRTRQPHPLGQPRYRHIGKMVGW